MTYDEKTNSFVQNNFPEEIDLEKSLCYYDKKDILQVANYVHCEVSETQSKNSLARTVARHMLNADNMKELLYAVSEQSLDFFETVAESDIPYELSDEEILLADDLLAYNCLYELSNDVEDITYVRVPSDIKVVYDVITKNGYRQKHSETRWIYACVLAFDRFYGSAAAEILFKIYKQKNGANKNYTELIDAIRNLPSDLRIISIVGDKAISNVLIKEKLSDAVEEHQRKVEYYIPTVEEAMALADNMYPANLVEYQKLFKFFTSKMCFDYTYARYIVAKIFAAISAGGMLSDFMREAQTDGLVFASKIQAEKFTDYFMAANNVTRMQEFRGHTPLEMRKMYFNNSSNIIPFNSKKTIVHDFNGAMISEKKIYPNDPCPCGSGKKYKKCCGRAKND